MKHKHYDKIVAKAANVELALFVKCGNKSKWREAETPTQFPLSEFDDVDYFLCLPKHKEACLYWLNGGKAEALHEDFGPMELAESKTVEWGVKSAFMKDSIEIRIKPKKEKRLIGYRDDVVYGPYLSIDDINPDFVATGQVIEIEVEV